MNHVKDALNNPAHWRKFWVALLAALLALVGVMAPIEGQEAFVVTTAEWYTVVVAFVGAFGVGAVRNK